MKLKVKIGGDVNIYLSPDADPVPLDIDEDVSDEADLEDRDYDNLSYFESAVNALKDLVEMIEHDSEESECADNNEIVMVFTPGNEPKVMTFEEAASMLPDFYDEFICIEDFMGKDNGLKLYYCEDQILRICGEKFLTGPSVMCFEGKDGDLRSLTGQEIYQGFGYYRNNKAAMPRNPFSVDQERINVIQIWK